MTVRLTKRQRGERDTDYRQSIPPAKHAIYPNVTAISHQKKIFTGNGIDSIRFHIQGRVVKIRAPLLPENPGPSWPLRPY